MPRSIAPTASTRRLAAAKAGQGGTPTGARGARREAGDVDKKAAELDAAQKKMQGAIDKESGTVDTEGDEIHLKLVDKVLFATGDDQLTDKGKTVLDKVAVALKDLPDKQVWVQGHTDDQPIFLKKPDPKAKPPAKNAKAAAPPLPPRKEYVTNWELSAARALNVVHYLQDTAKIDPTRLAALAFGQYRPVSRSQQGAQPADRDRRHRLVGTVLVHRPDAHPVGLAALQRPALVGGAQILSAEARALAGHVEERVDGVAELVGDLPAVTVGERWRAEHGEVRGVAFLREADRPRAARQVTVRDRVPGRGGRIFRLARRRRCERRDEVSASRTTWRSASSAHEPDTAIAIAGLRLRRIARARRESRASRCLRCRRSASCTASAPAPSRASRRPSRARARSSGCGNHRRDAFAERAVHDAVLIAALEIRAAIDDRLPRRHRAEARRAACPDRRARALRFAGCLSTSGRSARRPHRARAMLASTASIGDGAAASSRRVAPACRGPDTPRTRAAAARGFTMRKLAARRRRPCASHAASTSSNAASS